MKRHSSPAQSLLAVGTTLLLFTAGPLLAVPAPPYVEILGPLNLDVPAVQPGAGTVEVPIPVRYPDPTLAGKLKPAVTEVIFNGQSRTDLREAFALSEAAGGAGGTGSLRSQVTLAKIPDTGAYALRIAIFITGETAAQPQVVNLTFTRPAAEIQVSADPLRFEDVRINPLTSTLSPIDISLLETTGRAGVDPAAIQATSELRGPGDFLLPARLDFQSPDSLNARKQAPAKLSVSGSLPLGISRGTLTILSPQLAKPMKLSVEITSRLHRTWLMALLVIGILSGALLRTGLAKRQERLEALRAAQLRLGTLLEVLLHTEDEPLRKDLEVQVEAIRTAIRQNPRDPAALKAAVEAAGTAAEARLKAAEQDRAKLREQIARLKVEIGTPEPHSTPVRKALVDAAQRVAEQENALGRGAIGSVKEALDAEEANLKGALQEAVRQWLSDVRTFLPRLQPWAGTSFDTARQQIVSATDKLQTELDGLDVLELMRREASLASRIRNEILLAGPKELDLVAGGLLDGLRAFGDPALAPRLKIVEDRRQALREWAQGGTDLERLPSLLEPVKELADAFAEVLRAAVPPASAGDEPLETLLKDGRFPEALTQVAKLRLEAQKKSESDLREGSAPQPRSFALEALVSQLPWKNNAQVILGGMAAPPQPAWAIRIEAPTSPSEGQEIVLRAVPAGTPPPGLVVRWHVAGKTAVSSLPGELVWRFTPDRPGRLQILAEAFLPGTRERSMAEVTLEVRPAEGFAALPALDRQISGVEWAQTAVAGVLIAGAGYLIFSPAWIGIFPDIFAAFLWGFTTDIGTAKVLEIARPLLARPVPFPEVKPT
jgi:hypothetical protein